MKQAALVLALLAAAAASVEAKGDVGGTKPAARPDVQRLGEGRFRIGRIDLDLTSQTVRLPACVNMQKGIIELVACAEGGKLHESLFLAPIEPYHLHLALLLLGLKPTEGATYQGQTVKIGGDQVIVSVEKDGRQRRVEDYVWDIPRKAPMERTGWAFVARFVEDQYAPQMTRTLITTYHDPYTILDNPLPSGDDDTVYEVNHRVTPAVGTTVTLVVEPLKKKAAKGEKK